MDELFMKKDKTSQKSLLSLKLQKWMMNLFVACH